MYPRCYQGIYNDVEALGVRLGIRAAPHDLRRSFGRILYYEKGVDINEIRSLYGHATTEMTLYYIGAVSDKMRAAVQRFVDPHPTPVLPIPEGP